MKLSKPSITSSKQEGAALLISVVVLLALTIIALAATKSNQLQSLMLRNAQFRMETFNASYAEIDAQIDAINTSRLSNPPAYLNVLADRGSVDSEGGTAVLLPKFAEAEADYMVQSVAQNYATNCPVFGSELGVGQSNIRCHAIQITSNAELTDREFSRSQQTQIYTYKTLTE